MSLVNNSANNFKDFLDAIKPYLNYQFYDLSGQGVEANNFSTDEKAIGTWVDGKPLYQKSLYMGYLSEKDTTVNVEALSIDKVINMFGMIFNSSGEMIPVPNCEPNGNEWGFGCSYIGQSNVVRVRRNAMENPSTSYSYITLRYTKTTDTAVASGEKIVGQWIDGKPLYEKVYVLENALIVSNSSFTNTGISASNIDIILKCTCVDDNGSMSDNMMANTYGNGSAHTEVAIQTSGNSTGISINKIILRYTKTTD